jgi:siroheme synthase
MAGHICTPEGLDSIDWTTFSKLGTLVILMGVRNRSQIASSLILAGKDSKTPVAFIENATTEFQRVVMSNLHDVAQNIPEVSSPAVMVIGEVVKFHNEWNWFNPFEHKQLVEACVGL